MELELFVKVTKGGKPMTLPVKPSYSIEMIKTQIQSLREIPVKDQVLTLNGVELKNEDNLTQFQIENCVVWLSHKPKEISIHIFEDWRTKRETLKFEVDWTENIDEIQQKITYSKKIPRTWQNIYLGHGLWNEESKISFGVPPAEFNKKLSDEKIFKTAVKEGLSLMISGIIKVHDYDKGKDYYVEIEAFETITEAKRILRDHPLMEENERKKIKRSKFFDSNTESILYKRDENQTIQKVEDDTKTIYDFGIGRFVYGEFILTKNSDLSTSYQIFVKHFLDDSTIVIDCCDLTTLEELKNKIKDKVGIPPSEQLLRHNGMLLDEEHGNTLKDFAIEKENNLQCIRKQVIMKREVETESPKIEERLEFQTVEQLKGTTKSSNSQTPKSQRVMCDICEKYYVNRYSLNNHKKKLHPPVLPHNVVEVVMN